MRKDLRLRTTFDQVAELYDKIRPDYPEELFDELINKTGIDKNSRLLEIAPGTGQATLPLAKRGYNITAVELVFSLQKSARQKLRDYPNVEVITGAFEDVELPAESFDLVYVATAFHWIKPEVRFTKPYRLLKTDGYLAIINGNQVSDEAGDRFFHTAQPLYNKYWSSDPDNPFRLRHLSEVKPTDLDSNLFKLVHFNCFPHAISYTAEEYRQLINTDSEKLALLPDKRTKFLDEMKQLIDRDFNGSVSRYYANSLTIAKKVS